MESREANGLHIDFCRFKIFTDQISRLDFQRILSYLYLFSPSTHPLILQVQRDC